MKHPLPARAEVGEWEEHLRDLSERAERLIKAPKTTINDHAQLAIDALKVLWAGWSPELIYSSCQASLLLGAPVVAGRQMTAQLMEIEAKLGDWAEHGQQQPDPVKLQPVELLAPAGVLPPPRESKPRKPRRPRQPEQDLDDELEPELEALEIELEPEDSPAPEMPPMWGEPELLQHWDHPAAEPEPDGDDDADADADEGDEYPPWVPTEPEPAPEPEIISATELAAHFSKSLSWVNTLMNRREILKLGIHYRARRPGEPKGYKYFRDLTFAAIAESRQRPPRCERELERLADELLAELVG